MTAHYAALHGASNVCACCPDTVVQSLTMLDAVFSVKAKFPCVHV